MKLWALHGGSHKLLEAYKEFKPNISKRWEYGTGLYVTKDYNTVMNYIKGTRTLYLVQWDSAGHIENIKTPLCKEQIHEIMSQCGISKKSNFYSDYQAYLVKREVDFIYPHILLNLIINNNAVKESRTIQLSKELINVGANWGGDESKIACIWNPSIMKIQRLPKDHKAWNHDWITEFID